jgi:sugar lactone lactonase YvrE
MPRFRVGAASGSPRVLERVDADRGCFACMLGGADASTLYVVAADWSGVAGIGGRTGQVLTHPAPAPHAGHP